MPACLYKFVLVFLMCLSSAFATEVQTITLVEDPWPPYIEGRVGAPASGGKLVKLYKEVFSRIPSINVNYMLVPWKRALLEVEQGKQDGIMALFKTPERTEVMDFTVPIFTGRTMLWYSKRKHSKALSWKTTEDLTPYNIVIVRGSAMANPLLKARDNGVKLNFSEVNSHKQQFDMLARGRGDIAVLTEIVGHHLIHENEWDGNIVPMEKPLSADDVYYMAMSKKSPARKLIPEINRVIQAMQESGELYQILTN